MSGDGETEGKVDFQVHAFRPKEAPPLKLRLRVGSKELANWQFEDSKSCNRALAIPASMVPSAGWVSIKFEIESPRSPH